MNHIKTTIVGVGAVLAGLSASAIDITISENQGTTDFKFGSAANINAGAFVNNGGTIKNSEDQEVAAFAIANQTWDLEAFTLLGNKLSVVAGFDMKSGQAHGSVTAAGVTGGTLYTTPMGDIFLNVGSPVDARTTTSSPNPDGDGFDFDYVIKFTSITAGGVSYDVYKASDVTASPNTGPFQINPPSALLNGYLYKATPNGGASPLYSGSATYSDNVSSAASGGYLGTYHDIIGGISIDPTKLAINAQTVYVYTTVGCGNDIMEGKFRIPDGGLSLALFGMGLIGLGGMRRRNA